LKLNSAVDKQNVASANKYPRIYVHY